LGGLRHNLHRMGIFRSRNSGWTGGDPTFAAGGSPLPRRRSTSLSRDPQAWPSSSFASGMEKRDAARRDTLSHILWIAILGGTAGRIWDRGRALRHRAALGADV